MKTEDLKVLLDTLASDLDPQDKLLLADANNQGEILAFLDVMLSQDAESLLTPAQPSSSFEANAKNVMEELAELDNSQRALEKQIKDQLLKNIDLVIESNNEVNQYLDLFQQIDRSIYDMKGQREDEELKNLGNLNVEIEISSSVLNSIDDVMDILELPALTNICIKNGHYSECVDISSHLRRLCIRFPHLEVMKKVETDTQSEITIMINGLLKLLTTNLKQSNVVKIINYLRRLSITKTNFSEVNGRDLKKETSVFSTDNLKMIFLHSRYNFIMEELDDLKGLKDSNLHEKYLKRCIEVIREHSFATLMSLETIFQESSIDDRQLTAMLLSSYVKAIASRLCDILKESLPKVSDPISKDSLLLQTLYCSQSLGRKGCDFTVILRKELQNNCTPPVISAEEWKRVVQKQQDLVRTVE
ncbi:BA75_02111T0 [Komagataella pastoris]|uniref:Conserved oligomeric Golgi complex subunit 8 n=1 Tax=Komagataella pastoris TaxID=4922 RepID=A0A1B2JDP3_PICPA|nr:BA75_02111T0 [Komagataella pastoris]